MTDTNKRPEFVKFLIDLCDEILDVAYCGVGGCERKGNEHYYHVSCRIVDVVEQALESWTPDDALIDTYDHIAHACRKEICGVEKIERICGGSHDHAD